MGLATDQWKRTTDDYVNAANQLFGSMLNSGFSQFYAVPVDPAQEILDGSHRVACALAFWQGTIPVVLTTKRVWAPPWGLDWFVAKGMAQSDLDRLQSDWSLLTQ